PVLGIGDRAASAVAQGDRAARLPLPESRRRAAAGPRRAVVGPRTVGEPAAGALRPAPPARRRGLAPRGRRRRLGGRRDGRRGARVLGGLAAGNAGRAGATAAWPRSAGRACVP